MVDVIRRTVLGTELVFRRAHDTEFLVTACGKFVINSYYDHKITILCSEGCERKYRYLRVDGRDVHVLVAKAWVYNPAPAVFKTVDHIDRKVFNNAATNLRWITQRLNTLNRERTMYRKIMHKKKSGRWSIYYRSKVSIGDHDICSHFPTPDEAAKNTAKVLKDAFIKLYTATMAGAHATRDHHMYYWRDEAPTRFGIPDPGVRGVSESGEELSHLSLAS